MDEETIVGNEVNLCDSCCSEYPDCPDGNECLFGDGVGYDNVCCCNKYEALKNRHPEMHGKY